MKALLTAAALTLMGSALCAAPVQPVSYSIPNGNTGTYTYFDDSYDAPGAPIASVGALLTGGLGDLTDGIIATGNWNSTGSQAGATPYVGWFGRDPVLTFAFDRAYDFTSVTFHFDDSNGAGGVTPPASVRVNNNGFTQGVPDPASGAPFAFTMSLASVAPTDVLQFQIFRRNNSWIFLSEVTFEAPVPVPLPASGLLLLGAMGGLAMMRRKRV
ncbi:MAG: VPLPA-CTERM sorting domain-containing protein [Rhodobacteraceae bacterium]|nr:MAG: VPLPA-CTERM sorting domain-containing protein [Paracoccaceae bacterium]